MKIVSSMRDISLFTLKSALYIFTIAILTLMVNQPLVSNLEADVFKATA
jgi:hypothetical protein